MALDDDILYVSLLLVSIACGKLIRQIPPEIKDGSKDFTRRRFASTVFGITIAALVSGFAILHLFVITIINCFIILYTSYKSCHLVSLVVSFAYLIFFRLCGSLGFPPPPPHTNAIIMILTLKLVGLAFEVHDTKVRRLDPKTPPNFSDVDPGFMDIIHYGLSHVGLLTGPYYKYRTFDGMFSDPWNPAVSGEDTNRLDKAMWTRIRCVPFYVVAFLVSGYFFPLKIVETLEWQESSSIAWKLFYMTPIFFNFRMRIYSGFVLSECSCIMAGLGAFPVESNPRPGQGPSKPELLDNSPNQQLNFETVHNIDEWGSDFVSTMREALKCWNMTVQHWLVVVVYKRFPYKGILRTVAVMFVSSLWHGVHPGYYLSLCSVPLVLAVEDLYSRIIRCKLSPFQQAGYDWISWFFRMQWFSYLGMGFLLLRIDATLGYWSNIYYIGHIILPVFYILGLFVVKPLVSGLIGSGREEVKEKSG